MRLLRLARDKWDILAVCDENGDCLVLDFLDGLESNYEAAVRAMMALLREYVPSHGPTQLREPHSKSLGNGIFEFRKEPKGKRLRVLWFYDRGQVIVCTTAFTKAEKTPRAEIERCERFRQEYAQAQQDGTLRIDDPEDDNDEDEDDGP